MVFYSKLPKPTPPVTDVFHYIFHHGRRDYPRDRVVYRVHETGETLTLAELEDSSRRFASVLTCEFRIGVGDVVAIVANNSIRYPIAYFGALASGATVSPIAYQEGIDANALAQRLQTVDTKVLITDKHFLPLCQAASHISGNLPLVTLDDSTSIDPSQAFLGKLLTRGNPAFDAFSLKTQREVEDHRALIFRTSGSTGTIKSVLMPHAHWNTNLQTTCLTVPKDTEPDKDVWIAPLSFSYGITAKLHLGLNIMLGIPVVITLNPFDRSAMSLIDQHKITFLFMTPPLAAEIAHSEVTSTFPSIKWLLSAGAPIHPKCRAAVQDRFHGCPLRLEWASTETLLIALQVDDASALPGSSGTLVNGMEARVVSLETGEDLGPNERGEVLVRSSLCKFAGYLDNSVANKDFDEGGWYHTGDVGYIDENCNVFIVNRVKEFLRLGNGYGTHVSPGELEAVLFDHPRVATAVVVGIRDTTTQLEHPTAFVMLRQNKGLDTESQMSQVTLAELSQELAKTVETQLGAFKRVSGGVYFVDRFPQTGFKVNRRALEKLVHVGAGHSQQQRYIEVV